MFDENYKQILKNELNLDDVTLLHNIVGEEEFERLLKELNNNSYSPESTFCANLHIHTKYSDGIASVKEILDNAAEFSNKTNQTFLLAITDHDTIEGTKETIRLLVENSEKYKNLKVVFGAEISTTATMFKNQNKTFDVHTLVYCINPFDKNLNAFLDNKRVLKFNLANKVLNTLNSELKDVLDRFDIQLTLEEASKIHPMILKGEDEVSHPLKKYIFAKLLFSYYVENNLEIFNMLKHKDVDMTLLSYEKPVFKYKNMFNNERYFYIYRDALEKYLNDVVKNDSCFSLEEIPEWLETALLRGKALCEKAHPMIEKECIGIDAFSDFESTVEFISALDFGLMSIAHPARLNLKNTDSDKETFYTEFFETYKKYGKEKAYAYEKYYQSYTGKKHFDCLKTINKTAELFNLKPTGGIDCHGKNIFTRV